MLKRTSRYSFSKGIPKQKIVDPLFIVRFQKSETPTYGVVAPKSVSKKAVLRNKTKRIFILALQEVLKGNQNKYTLVFFLRRPCHEYSKSVIINTLSNIIQRINS